MGRVVKVECGRVFAQGGRVVGMRYSGGWHAAMDLPLLARLARLARLPPDARPAYEDGSARWGACLGRADVGLCGSSLHQTDATGQPLFRIRGLPMDGASWRLKSALLVRNRRCVGSP